MFVGTDVTAKKLMSSQSLDDKISLFRTSSEGPQRDALHRPTQ